MKNLKKLLTDLGFEVNVHRNLIKGEFDSQVRDFSKDPKHEKGHMMIMAVLSHGRDGIFHFKFNKYLQTEFGKIRVGNFTVHFNFRVKLPHTSFSLLLHR